LGGARKLLGDGGVDERSRGARRPRELARDVARNGTRFDHVPIAVERRRGRAERDRRLVALRLRRHVRRELRRFSGEHDEHAARGRVERACVAHRARPERPPQARDDVVARRADRLVDDEDAV
jgi:hypothetical protein